MDGHAALVATFLASVLALCTASAGCASKDAASSSRNAGSVCHGYEPMCISGDSICSSDANGCRICTCQSREGRESAPDMLVPGTSSPAAPMGR